MRTGLAPGADQRPETEQEPVPARAHTPPGYLSERGRDLRIDFLRGYFVFAMVVDHVRGPSWLYAITGGNHFYTSAAEGFIFVSGLVAGLVYRRLIERDGLGPSLRRVIQRAGQLYLLAVGLTLIFVPLSEILDLPWSQGVDLSNPIGFIVSAFTLHRTYYLVDVPSLAPSKFEKRAARLVRLIEHKNRVTRREAMRTLRLNKREMDDLQATLVERGEIRTSTSRTSGPETVWFETSGLSTLTPRLFPAAAGPFSENALGDSSDSADSRPLGADDSEKEVLEL